MWNTPSSGKLGLLTLLNLRGIGPRTAESLATRFPTLRQIQEAPPSTLAEFALPQACATLSTESNWETAYDLACQTIDKANRLSIKIITALDSDFPVLLKSIPDAPLIIYLKGKLQPENRYVACVGTREPSQFGIEATRGIVRTLTQNGWSIVSGLAMGIDTVAHQTALEEQGHTVAILGNSLEDVYPPSNAQLADKILASGGALMSEQPFGTQAIPRTLVKRDRLQSGMSVATIAMQTDISGGTMHTVRYTLEQGHILIVPVPQGKHAEEPKSRGILALAEKTGAELCSMLNAEGKYAKLLQTEFANRKVSLPIVSREQYTEMLTWLADAQKKYLFNPQMPLF